MDPLPGSGHQRISVETDARRLLPLAWKEDFEAEVIGRRNEIVELLVEDQRER